MRPPCCSTGRPEEQRRADPVGRENHQRQNQSHPRKDRPRDVPEHDRRLPPVPHQRSEPPPPPRRHRRQTPQRHEIRRRDRRKHRLPRAKIRRQFARDPHRNREPRQGGTGDGANRRQRVGHETPCGIRRAPDHHRDATVDEGRLEGRQRGHQRALRHLRDVHLGRGDRRAPQSDGEDRTGDRPGVETDRHHAPADERQRGHPQQAPEPDGPVRERIVDDDGQHERESKRFDLDE
jgi:hypothetical protein